MGLAAAEAAIRARFDSLFPAKQPGVSIVHDNRHGLELGATAEWVRLAVLGGPARMLEVGGRTSENLGRIVVQVFIPLGALDGAHQPTGTARARAIADSVAEVFQGQTFSGVTCYATEEVPVGADPDGKPFWQMNASTRFYFENAPA